MLADLEHQSADQPAQCDICIVGSGAAGITLAREFLGTKYTVILLEGGGLTMELDSQDPYASKVSGLHHVGINEGRARAVGGTTLLWAGQALPLFDIDFETRNWVPYSGWPLRRDTIEPFYRRAEDVMQIKHVDYGAATWPSGDLPPYDPSLIIPAFSQFAREPNFAKKYLADLKRAPNIRVLYHANVTSLEATQNASAVKEVRVMSFGRRMLLIEPRYVVICAGGIESARVLLLSDSVESTGIGNQHDVVGRFFQDHPSVDVPVRTNNPDRFHKWCDPIMKRFRKYTLKMVPSDSLIRKTRITNVGAEVYYRSQNEDLLIAAKTAFYALQGRTNRAQLVPSLGRLARDPGKAAAVAYNYYLKGRSPSMFHADTQIAFFCEQEPNPESRMTLAQETDSLGMRRVVLDWRLTGAEITAVNVLAKAISHEWRRLDLGDLDLGLLPITETRSLKNFRDLNHHIGTCRMGTDRRTSVVDPRCKVHGYDNLYIGSSATFPTGGFSNPTLTIIALCLRIADDLKLRLSSGQQTVVA